MGLFPNKRVISEKTVELNTTNELLGWLQWQTRRPHVAVGPSLAQEGRLGFAMGYLGNPLALRLYEEIIHKDGRLRGKAVKPVTIINTRDVESIEAVVQHGAAWSDFLTRKHTERHVDDSFHNYVYRSFAGKIPGNNYLAIRWERIGHMIGMRLFGETLDRA